MSKVNLFYPNKRKAIAHSYEFFFHFQLTEKIYAINSSNCADKALFIYILAVGTASEAKYSSFFPILTFENMTISNGILFALDLLALFYSIGSNERPIH